MGNRFVKMAAYNRLTKLANVAGLIQRSRMWKFAAPLLPGGPEAQESFERALEAEFRDKDAQNGYTWENPEGIDYSQPPLPPVPSAYARTMEDREPVSGLSRTIDQVRARDTSSAPPMVASNDMLSSDLASGPDGYTRSPAEEYIAPMDPSYAEFKLPKTQAEYARMMQASAENVYGKRWRDLTPAQKTELHTEFEKQVGDAYRNGNNEYAYVPKWMQNLYGYQPQYEPEVPGRLDGPQSNMVAQSSTPSQSALGTTSPQVPSPLAPTTPTSTATVARTTPGRLQAPQSPSAMLNKTRSMTRPPQVPQQAAPMQPKPVNTPPTQQAFNRTRQPQQRYVFNGPIARGIRRRNGGPVFNGPVANRFRRRFGR